MVTHKGLKKDPDLAKKIDQAIFPRLQGGPHDHQTAAIAVALGEAMKPSFKTYGHQVVKNAKALAKALMARGVNIVTDGTDNHMILIQCGKGGESSCRTRSTPPASPSTKIRSRKIRLHPSIPASTPRNTLHHCPRNEGKRNGKTGRLDRSSDGRDQVFSISVDKSKIKPTLIKFRKFVAKSKNLKKIKGEVKNSAPSFRCIRI